MGASQPLVRRRDILRRLADEVVHRTPVEAAHHVAARQAAVLAADDDPLVLDLQEPEFQRPAVQLGVEELRMAVLERRKKSKRGQREHLAAVGPHRAVDVGAVRRLEVGAWHAFPMREILLDQRVDSADGDHPVADVWSRLCRPVSGVARDDRRCQKDAEQGCAGRVMECSTMMPRGLDARNVRALIPFTESRGLTELATRRLRSRVEEDQR